jgi:hypothetical protein
MQARLGRSLSLSVPPGGRPFSINKGREERYPMISILCVASMAVLLVARLYFKRIVAALELN